ncbi:MAG: toxin-antitoxin system HicB family antitoxin [Thermomicrobiales bacterium]
MNLQRYVDHLRQELRIAAEAGGDDARALAERLSAPLDAAVRLTLLDALATAADEISRDLAPGAVEVRLRGLEPTFVVTSSTAADSGEEADHDTRSAPPRPIETEDGGAARINLRLPESLKVRVEEAARGEHISINAWLTRAVAAALEDGERGRRSGRGGHGGQRHTGWVR